MTGGPSEDNPERSSQAAADTAAERAPAPSALARTAALSALVVPQALVLVVQGAAPLLLRSAPLLLLVLHPFAPWHVLVSARTDAVAFLSVYVTVRALPCVGDYFVGRWYGVRVLDRLGRRRRVGRLTRLLQRISQRAGGLLLVLYPGVTASVLAGSNAMPWRRFLPLMIFGVVLAAVYVRVLATVASGLIDQAADLVEENALPLGIALTLAVLLTRPWRRWAG